MKDIEGRAPDEDLGEEQIDGDNLEKHPSRDINRRGAEFKGRIRVTVENRAKIPAMINMIISSNTSLSLPELKDRLLGDESIRRELERDDETPLNLDAEILDGLLSYHVYYADFIDEEGPKISIDEIKQLIEKVDLEYFNQYPSGKSYEKYRKERMRGMNLMLNNFF